MDDNTHLKRKFFNIIIFNVFVCIILICNGCNKKTTSNDKLDILEQANQKQIEYQNQFGIKTNELVFAHDIFVALVRNDVTNFTQKYTDNGAYQTVSKEWIQSEFTTSLWKFFIDTHVLNDYDRGTFDCKHYSFGSYYLGNELHRNSKDHIDGASLAIGVIYYFPDNKNGETHAINVFILKDKSIVFFEPQTQQIVNLSLVERQSIYRIQF